MEFVRYQSTWFETWKMVSPVTECCQRFMMICYLDGLCPSELCRSKNLEKCVRDYHVRGLCPGIISRVISLFI